MNQIKNNPASSRKITFNKGLAVLSMAFVLASCGDSDSSSVSGGESQKEDENVEYASASPNLIDLEISGDTLFALFQRYTPDEFGYATFLDNGLLAMYNLKKETLLDTISLATKNPTAVKVAKGNVYVASQGEYNESWGTDADEKRGIEKIDLKKKKSELWVSGKKLGGGVYSFDVDGDSEKAFASIYKSYGDVPVAEIKLKNGSVKMLEGIADAEGSLAVNEKGILYAGDRSKNVVYTYDGKKVKTAYDESRGLSPYSIAFGTEETFVFVSDFSSGKLFWMVEDDLVADKKALDFDADSKVISADGEIYVLERTNAGSISKLDAKGKKVAWQKSADSGNPSDIVAYKGNLWVGMYNSPEIRIISAKDGSKVSSIDTKTFCAKK